MSQRRSDQLPAPAPPEGPAGAAEPLAAPPEHHDPRGARTPLLSFLKTNAAIPVLVLLLLPLANLVESKSFGAYNARIVTLIGYNIILAVSLQLINGVSGQFSLGHAGFMAVGAYLAAYPAKTYARGFLDPAATLLFYVALAIVVAIVGAVLYGLLRAAALLRNVHRSLPGIALILLIAWIAIDVSKAADLDVIPTWCIWSRGFALLESLFAGILQHGGAAANSLSSHFPAAVAKSVCFIVLLLGAGACAAATGLIVGLPALRLRGDYLAIATLGMAEIIRILIQNSRPLGGALGLTGIPRYTTFPWLYAAVIVTVVCVWRVAYSARGRAIMAVREDEIAASAVGINTTRQKVTAFVLGAFFAGVAGALFALNEYSITPTRFTLDRSIEVVVMVTLGGLGSISGAILAAVVLTILPEFLRDPPSALPWGYAIVALIAAIVLFVRGRKGLLSAAVLFGICIAWDIVRYLAIRAQEDLSKYRMIIYSAALIIMMLARPQGLLGTRELWPRRLFNRKSHIANRQSPVAA